MTTVDLGQKTGVRTNATPWLRKRGRFIFHPRDRVKGNDNEADHRGDFRSELEAKLEES